MQSMGILPEDTMAEAGRKVWSYQLAEMLRNEEGTRKGEDIEALHDMRVASRRMRAAFDIFSDAFDPQAIKPYLKGLRATGRALGRVRDLDVFMEKADEYRETLLEEQRSGLEPLLEAWESEREKARAEMLAHLNSRKYHDFIWAFNSFLNTPGEGTRPAGQNPPAPDRVCEVAPVLIYTRLAAVRAYDRLLGHATIEQLHALRIEFKKLRYAVEFFREVLGDESKATIGELKTLQDHLGELHDADIATQILREFLQTWETEQESLPANEQQSPAGILNYLAARFNERQRLMTTFPEAWQRFSQPEFRMNLALAVSKL
jgi:CHAD domain-containing protein